MAEQAHPALQESAPGAEPGALTRWQAGALLLLFGFLYWDVMARLMSQWWNDPNFSHGFFVPAFSAYVLWNEKTTWRGVPARPAWFGLLVVAGASAMLVVGILGAELFLSRSSLVWLLAGSILLFQGWPIFRALWFPWAFLFLMIPIPAIVFNQVAFPLQLLASRAASELLELLSVPVLREGNVLRLPAMSLEVVEACSGIRSLISLGTLSIIYGYLLERRNWVRVSLAVASVPIAVAANALRIVGTGVLAHWFSPETAQGFFHSFSGWVIFVLSLAMLILLHTTMNWLLGARGSNTGAGGQLEEAKP